MADPICEICDRPTDGWACARCADRAAVDLSTLASLVGHARAVVYGQARHGTPVGGGGKPGSRIELNLAAGARLDAVQAELTTWARHIVDERGLTPPEGIDLADVARWLVRHAEWLRHRQEGPEALRAIRAARRVLQGVVDGPADRHWLGTCDADGESGRCEVELYAHRAQTTVRCPGCGAEHDVAARRQWLDRLAQDYAYTAAEISGAYGIPAATIRSWANRGRLTVTGYVKGWPTYLLRDVLDLRARHSVERTEGVAA